MQQGGLSHQNDSQNWAVTHFRKRHASNRKEAQLLSLLSWCWRWSVGDHLL